jgi:CHRD domain-containing protein
VIRLAPEFVRARWRGRLIGGSNSRHDAGWRAGSAGLNECCSGTVAQSVVDSDACRKENSPCASVARIQARRPIHAHPIVAGLDPEPEEDPPMRLRYPLLLVLGVGLLAACAALADTGFVVQLSGANEVPSNGSTATGSGTLVLNVSQTNLSFNITHNVVNETAAHIHNAPIGVNGGVVFGLPPGSPKIGSWAQPGIQSLNVTLDQSQEPSPTGSSATGTSMLTFNAGPSNLDWTLTHNVTNQTAAHFHRQAPGMNGAVVQGIGVGSPLSGTWAMPFNLTRSLFSDSIYVNVHSMSFPGGEIRGNISFPPSQIKELFGARYYVNIHSSAFPDGEIRGQILLDEQLTPVRANSWGRLKSLYR